MRAAGTVGLSRLVMLLDQLRFTRLSLGVGVAVFLLLGLAAFTFHSSLGAAVPFVAAALICGGFALVAHVRVRRLQRRVTEYLATPLRWWN